MASTHYDMDLPLVSSGYIVLTGASADAASAIMNDADAAVEEFATVLAGKLWLTSPRSRSSTPLKIRRGEDNL